MLTFTPWMDDCLDTLESSPAASATDRMLSAEVRLQRIAESNYSLFAFDDTSRRVGLDETRVQILLRGFESQLDDWNRDYGQVCSQNGKYCCCCSIPCFGLPAKIL